MTTEQKLQKIKEIISEQIGDDCYFSLMIFIQETDDLWQHKNIHNFEREAVIMAMRNTADRLEEIEDEDDFNLN